MTPYAMREQVDGTQKLSGRKKKCIKCFKTRPIEDFGENKTSSDGYQSYCSVCRNKVHQKMRKENISLRLHHHFHTRITQQLLGLDIRLPDDLYSNMEYYIKYTFKQLVKKLDKECVDTYNFNLKTALNVHKYHIDHIRPLSSFQFTSINSDEFRRCWAMTNLVAIPASENLAKGARFEDVETNE